MFFFSGLKKNQFAVQDPEAIFCLSWKLAGWIQINTEQIYVVCELGFSEFTVSAFAFGIGFC